MNEADRKVLDLVAWFKASGEKPSAVEIWKSLDEFAPVEKSALARQERNRRYYEKKKQSVLKGLNGRLKTSEKSEIVLNGVKKKWVPKQVVRIVNDDMKARGFKTFPLDSDDGWYVDTVILERLRDRINAGANQGTEAHP